MTEPEQQIRARLAELLQERTQPYFDKDGKEDGRCLRKLPPEQRQVINTEENTLKAELRTILLAQADFPKERVGYAVAGWDDRHHYFRNRVDVYDSMREARSKMEELKADANWRIPTIIVKMSWWLHEATDPQTFDSCPLYQMGFANQQELLDKHLMGSSRHTWASMLAGRGFEGGKSYTY